MDIQNTLRRWFAPVRHYLRDELMINQEYLRYLGVTYPTLILCLKFPLTFFSSLLYFLRKIHVTLSSFFIRFFLSYGNFIVSNRPTTLEWWLKLISLLPLGISALFLTGELLSYPIIIGSLILFYLHPVILLALLFWGILLFAGSVGVWLLGKFFTWVTPQWLHIFLETLINHWVFAYFLNFCAFLSFCCMVFFMPSLIEPFLELSFQFWIKFLPILLTVYNYVVVTACLGWHLLGLSYLTTNIIFWLTTEFTGLREDNPIITFIAYCSLLYWTYPVLQTLKPWAAIILIWNGFNPLYLFNYFLRKPETHNILDIFKDLKEKIAFIFPLNNLILYKLATIERHLRINCATALNDQAWQDLVSLYNNPIPDFPEWDNYYKNLIIEKLCNIRKSLGKSPEFLQRFNEQLQMRRNRFAFFDFGDAQANDDSARQQFLRFLLFQNIRNLLHPTIAQDNYQYCYFEANHIRRISFLAYSGNNLTILDFHIGAPHEPHFRITQCGVSITRNSNAAMRVPTTSIALTIPIPTHFRNSLNFRPNQEGYQVDDWIGKLLALLICHFHGTEALEVAIPGMQAHIAAYGQDKIMDVLITHFNYDLTALKAALPEFAAQADDKNARKVLLFNDLNKYFYRELVETIGAYANMCELPERAASTSTGSSR